MGMNMDGGARGNAGYPLIEREPPPPIPLYLRVTPRPAPGPVVPAVGQASKFPIPPQTWHVDTKAKSYPVLEMGADPIGHHLTSRDGPSSYVLPRHTASAGPAWRGADCPEVMILPLSSKTYGRTFYEYRPRTTATFSSSSKTVGKEWDNMHFTGVQQAHAMHEMRQTLAARKHTWDLFSAKWVQPGSSRGQESLAIAERFYGGHSNTGIHRSMAQSMKPSYRS